MWSDIPGGKGVIGGPPTSPLLPPFDECGLPNMSRPVMPGWSIWNVDAFGKITTKTTQLSDKYCFDAKTTQFSELFLRNVGFAFPLDFKKL